jgi:ribosomal protein S18 acetylase RimI-like enzyme
MQLSPLAGEPSPSAALVRACVDDLAARGHHEVRTAALAPAEQTPFAAAGLEPLEELHLLVRSLDTVADAPRGITLRRPRRGDWDTLDAVDAAAFMPFWHLDRAGIAEAQHATPSHRLRVAPDRGDLAVVGYAIHGRAGRRGYVQRLAVHPSVAGRGLGSALLIDGLRWLRARGAITAHVNTQVGNERALALYLRHGFRLEPYRLAVLGTPGTAP